MLMLVFSTAAEAWVCGVSQGYFTGEQYINDRDFLLSAAKQAGLPEGEAAAVLDDPNAMRKEVTGYMDGCTI